MVTLARCLIAFFFVASGAGKIFAFRPSSTILASIGFPIPTFFLTAIIAVEIVGRLGLLFNVWTSYVAVALIVLRRLAAHELLRDLVAADVVRLGRGELWRIVFASYVERSRAMDVLRNPYARGFLALLILTGIGLGQTQHVAPAPAAFCRGE